MRHTSALTALAILLGHSGVVAAQEPTGPATGQQSLEFGDIVVTAQKRAESLQTVPLAVTALSDAALARAGVQSFSDLTKVVPSLTFTPGDQPANSSVILRGIGTFAFSIGVEPSVAVVIDDVPVAFQSQAFTDLIDLERVEVLRGPQSTLFGKSASAGLVNITTAAPTSTFTARADLRVTDDDEQRAAVSLSGPISDTLSFRLSADASRFDGLVRDLEKDERLNGRRERGVRGKLLWQPTDALEITLQGRYRDTDADCCVSTLIALDPAANFYNLPQFPQSVALEGITVDRDNLSIRTDDVVRSDTRDRGGSLRVSYEAGEHTLLSVTSYTRFNLRDSQDLDGTAVNLNQAVSPDASAGGRENHGRFDAEQWTQELRLISPDDGRLRYVLGGFFADSDLSRAYFRGPLIGRSNWEATVSNRNYALFGQATWEFIDDTSLIGGLRVNREEISYVYDNLLNGLHFSGDDADTAITGKIGLEHRFTPDIMVFGFYARGYKGQSYDLTSSLNAAIAARQPVKPETSDDFEVGVRSQFLDRRLTLNLTLFNTTYDNFQAQEGEPTLSGAFILSNVGSVRTRGAELEAAARIGDRLTLGGGLSFIDARIREFERAQCYAGQTAAEGCVGGVQDLAGARLNNAPKWRFNLRGDYTVPLDNMPFDGIVSLSYTWQSKVNFALSQDPITEQDAYGIANLQVGILDHDDRYSVALFINNLFDQEYAAGLANAQNYYGGRLAVNRLPGRDFNRYGGIRITASY
ncbi:TonB-dependent receptor [Pedomonas mirosovicensis]|uniref:TonB-dependent receptor n=1 Tax=Pedomonas mirosovicensis TaxID=2908641 RepID=UPI002169DAC6|nr:TonB-dependent receptor [Pedomonas mirosovicensis]MCH8686237.1 TonB-dependent receptor [Pedomonas mirosovicensis]